MLFIQRRVPVRRVTYPKEKQIPRQGVSGLLRVIQEARECTVCTPHLPYAPRPLFAASGAARVLIIGQAPGEAAHVSGVPWNDRSGKRLRAWLGMDDSTFYDSTQVALLPMGFCYPGKGDSGDLEPRPECAPLWHDRFLAHLRSVRITLYVGRFPLERYFKNHYDSVTRAVQDYAALLPGKMILPHPSPRNQIWLKKNRWFEIKAVPVLQRAVRSALKR